MDQRNSKDAPSRDKAEDAFRRASALHQQGDVTGALRLYEEIVRQHPQSPTSEQARTLIAGLRQERVNTLLHAASEARAQCSPGEALKLYQRIIEDSPNSPEAKSARAEIELLGDIQSLWESALRLQAQGNEPQALVVYQQIASRHPGSPEAENAGLLMAILHQNQLIPRGEAAYGVQPEENTPEQIVANLLRHRRAAAGAERTADPEMAKEAAQSQKIEGLWTQAVSLEQEGNTEEALILYRKIISASVNGHRVRDAKYRIEKMKAREESLQRSFSVPQQWGLEEDHRQTLFARWGGKRALVIAGVVFALLGAAALVYLVTLPPSWTDIVENAKKAVVVVKTPGGAGTGFLISQNGDIITNAQLVGKETDVDVRLYSGVLKRAQVIRAGMKLLDVAHLKIDGQYEHYLPLDGAVPCQDGAEVRVIGAPLGVEYFITRGIINHCSVDQYGVKYIQTDSAITVGNSGGPCLNREGRVLGLSTSIQAGDSAASPNLILPRSVITDFMAGRLTALEESLFKYEEEHMRMAEESKQQIYAAIESTNKRLQQVSAQEHKAYLAKVSDLLRQRLITYEQSEIMVGQVNYGPSGSIPTAQWVQSLALKVAKGAFSEEAAVQLIKEQYRIR